jgi:competence protein ComEA
MSGIGRLLVVAAVAVAVAACAGLGQSVSIPQQGGRAPSVLSRSEPLDINTATAAELRALPGMGDEYARRIIAGRPYTAKNQLVGRGILPQPAYERIAALVVARRQKSVTK